MTVASNENSVTPRTLVGTATLMSTSHGRSDLQNVAAAPSEARPPQTLPPEPVTICLNASEAHITARVLRTLPLSLPQKHDREKRQAAAGTINQM